MQKILIVEDDMDVRNFLQQEISPYFEVLVASNGNEGFDIAKNTELDLIISDVMMPVCSGFDMTRKLRNDLATSHIPIILLTALDSDDNHVKGPILASSSLLQIFPIGLWGLQRIINVVCGFFNLFSKSTKSI